jgi:hypothetical protein
MSHIRILAVTTALDLNISQSLQRVSPYQYLTNRQVKQLSSPKLPYSRVCICVCVCPHRSSSCQFAPAAYCQTSGNVACESGLCAEWLTSFLFKEFNACWTSALQKDHQHGPGQVEQTHGGCQGTAGCPDHWQVWTQHATSCWQSYWCCPLNPSVLCCSAFAAYSSSGIGQGVSIKLADRVSLILCLLRFVPAAKSSTHALPSAVLANG